MLSFNDIYFHLLLSISSFYFKSLLITVFILIQKNLFLNFFLQSYFLQKFQYDRSRSGYGFSRLRFEKEEP